ncbi:hypothetical protein KRP22_009915 [Phytophthora ramorum]|nr:hypothetical protein KRP22_10088 [Phytophthora ramorum]
MTSFVSSSSAKDDEEVKSLLSSNATLALAVSEKRVMPAFHSDCPRAILDLARTCLSYDPDDRPSAKELWRSLQDLASPGALLTTSRKATLTESIRHVNEEPSGKFGHTRLCFIYKHALLPRFRKKRTIPLRKLSRLRWRQQLILHPKQEPKQERIPRPKQGRIPRPKQERIPRPKQEQSSRPKQGQSSRPKQGLNLQWKQRLILQSKQPQSPHQKQGSNSHLKQQQSFQSRRQQSPHQKQGSNSHPKQQQSFQSRRQQT